jgi:hypothetical protein
MGAKTSKAGFVGGNGQGVFCPVDQLHPNGGSWQRQIDGRPTPGKGQILGNAFHQVNSIEYILISETN